MTGAPPAATASTRSGAASPAAARLIACTAVPVSTVHAAGGQLGVDQGAECRVDGGQHLGELLHLGDRAVPGWSARRPSPGRCSRRRR